MTATWQTRRIHLPFRTPFRFGHQAISARESVLLRVCWEEGVAGEGEAAPLATFVDAPIAAVETACGTLASALLAAAPFRQGGGPAWSGPIAMLGAMEQAWAAARLDLATPAHQLARAAVETAFAEAAAAAHGLPVARWLSRQARPDVGLNATLGRGTADERRRAAEQACADGFRVLKVKLGDGAMTSEVEGLRTAIADLGVKLRFDFNRTRPASTLRELDALVGLPIQYVEEPVEGDARALIRAAAAVGLPLAADESLLAGEQVDAPLARAGIGFFVLKPGFLGGPLTTLRRARLAAREGVRCTITTALDSAVGRTMALHLAAAIEGEGLGTGAHGLATGRFLAADVAAAPTPDNGRMQVPQTPGLGLGGAAGCR